MTNETRHWHYTGYADHCDVGRKYHEIVDDSGFEVINQNGILDGQGEEGAANAQRIVACVNAMDGIENPEEFVRQGKAVPELLGACKAASRGAHHPECPIAQGTGQITINSNSCTCHVRIARAAIAKATGEN